MEMIAFDAELRAEISVSTLLFEEHTVTSGKKKNIFLRIKYSAVLRSFKKKRGTQTSENET